MQCPFLGGSTIRESTIGTFSDIIVTYLDYNVHHTTPHRAAAYIKLQELQKALEDCKKAVELNPSYARAHGRMG